jgi:hypothetical protein
MFRGIHANRRSELKDYISANAVIPSIKPSNTGSWVIYGSIAASLVLFAGIYFLVPRIQSESKEIASASEKAQKPVPASPDTLIETIKEEGLADSVFIGAEVVPLVPPPLEPDEPPPPPPDGISTGDGSVDDRKDEAAPAQNKSLNQEEYFSVKADEFLGDTSVQLLVLAQAQAKPASQYGSEYKKNQDSRDTTEPAKDKAVAGMVPGATYKIEFWKSPINYKGYRFNARKLLLFGIADTSFEAVFELDGQFFLKAEQRFYFLKQDDTFNSYIPVLDKNILIRLKN